MINRIKTLSLVACCLLAVGASLYALEKAVTEDDQHGLVIVTGGRHTVIVDGRETGVESPDPDSAPPEGMMPLVAACTTNVVVTLYGGGGTGWVVPAGFTNCATPTNNEHTFLNAGCIFGARPCSAFTGGYTLRWHGPVQTTNQMVGSIEIYIDTAVCSNCPLGQWVDFVVPKGDTTVDFRCYMEGTNVPPGCPSLGTCVSNVP
jgi:hypothetical protein